MRQILAVGLMALLCLTMAACGDEQDGSAGEPPQLPSALAAELASQSEAIAASAEAGETCQAAHRADDLRASVESAIGAGDVPRPFRDDLLAASGRLQSTLECPEPEPAPPSEPEPEKEKPAPAAPDCEALEEQRDALEEQAKEEEKAAKHDKERKEEIKESFEDRRETLDERIEACREQQGGGVAAP